MNVTVRVTDDGVPALDDFETIAITVNEVNAAPVLNPIGDQTVDEETLLSFVAAASDADVPANGLTYSLDPGAPAGASIDPASGAFSWTPAEADGPGSFTVTVRVTDDGTPALDDSETINITVIEINDPPFLIPGGDVPDLTMDEDDVTVTVEVRNQFDDPDLGDTPPDVLNVIVLPGYDTGLVTITPNGTGVDVTPVANQYGSTTVTVGVEDKASVQATDTFVLTINSVNDPVQVASGVADQGAAEDVGSVSVDITGAFSDVDIANGGDSHTVTVTSSNPSLIVPTNSPLAALGGNVDFAVTPNANGTATITLVAEDAAGTQATTSFTMTIAPVTDPPFVATPIPDQTVAEDSGSLNVSLVGVFDDPDLINGDVQNYSVSHDNPTLITSATIAGSALTLNFGPDQNGTANVTVTVTDISGNTASDTFVMDVTAVNDDPTVVSPIADINTMEDDPTTFTVDLSTVFGDVDIATNGDTLTFATSNTNPGLFDVETLTGSLISLHLGPDQNGTATITVTATDTFGQTATDSFDVNVTPVNDLPVATDDFVGPLNEDPGLITIPVLANDYLAETPTVIGSAGVGGYSEGTPTIVLNALDDPIADPNGTVTVVGNQIQYLPKDDFFGTDYFTYTIVDSDGDVSPPATVTIQIDQVNDPPEGVQQRTFAIYENQTLTVDPTEGVFTGSYDVDGALLDASGTPVGSALSAVLTVPPPMGSLTFDNATGGFQFTPPINFTGEISFFYRLFDGIDVSAGSEYEVRVVVNAIPPAPPPPAPGTVAITYNISNVPLEQTSNVSPNVLVVMDDSGSMDWNLIVSGTDEQGGFTLDNSPIATGGRYATSYVYLWDLPTNAYPPNSDSGRILPTEEALNADSAMTGNQYGVWRARNYKSNRIYYNPAIMYRPWIGQDITNNDFTDADPAAIRLDPRDPSNTMDILSLHTYRASQVPEWDANGGRNNVDVDGTESLYIPRYYTTTANAPLAWDDPHTLVEITAANGPWPAANGREDCAADGDPTTCSYAEEIQNFANWFQYYRSREYVTKSSIGRVIAELQDIRIGYETISNTGSEEIRLMNELYTEGNKKLLLDNVYDVDSYGGTPLRQALGRAGQIFACQTGTYCPALPAPDGMCQQNFALLFSDGYWNGGAGVPDNDDIDGFGPFDGGRYADNVNATLADVAMYYYENDIQPTLDDEVPLSRADIDGAPPGTFDANNNTMHQHMKTYAIAFGVAGTIDPNSVPIDPTTAFSWTDPFSGSFEKIDDMLHAAVNGRGRFISASDPVELQGAFEQAFLEFTQAASSTSAAAFNSTSLRDGTLLYRGFFDLRDNTGELTATVVNTDGSLEPAPVWRASEMLNPVNILPDNRLLISADAVSGDGIAFRHSDLSPEHQLMMSEDEVNYIRGERDNESQNGGVLRERPATNGLLGDIVNSSPVFVGTPRAINRDQAPYPTADLYSDFAAAKFSRLPVVYVGANDGIMHGFDAQTGLERFGYIPSKIMDTSERYHNDLEDFTSPFYQHKFYVDLTPSLNDVYMRPSRAATGKEWVTLMIGGLGAGGKGYFALNVTDPDTQFASEANASGTVLWEFTDEDDTYPVDGSGNPIGGGSLLDPSGRPVKDLGVALSQPTITMSNVSDGGAPAQKEWVAVFGNGLNSTAGIAKLFVLFVDRGVDGWDPGDVVKIDTGFGVPVSPAPLAGYPNGLGTPTAVDIDLNGTVDWVYAGDRLGNLYRFDLTDPNPDNWTSTRLFTASYTDGGGNTTVQPILSKPVVSKHPTEDGFLITFGTGSYVAREDASSQDIQSIYTIWDRGEINPVTAQSDTKALRLVEQVMTNVVDDSVTPAQTRRIISSNPVDYVSEGATPGVYGWYIDLDMPRATTTLSGAANPDTSGLPPPGPQFPGEKAIRRLLFRDGTIIATTVLPSVGATSCFGARPGAIILFDALTGGNPTRALVDFNNDGYVDDNDLVEVNGESYMGGLLFDQDALDGSLVDPSVLGGEGDTDFLFISGGNETTSFRILDVNDNRTGRLSWQELD
ncbi:MAG: PilC/PilY family type IV pilus protein [Pseudomonadales bacterium]